MASTSTTSATSGKITASDMVAVVKVNWDKLAARAGFQDGATAKAHYEPLLLPRDRPGDTSNTRQTSRDNNSAPTRVKTETDDRCTIRYSYFEDGEA
ncbi:hypothetical protein GGR57DRAFT_505760 [Xylariaceae sp. FL1272]|nr:hypothetical protein GGR57DRAFT_505760 [Xylariaceae sp. FL1272]